MLLKLAASFVVRQLGDRGIAVDQLLHEREQTLQIGKTVTFASANLQARQIETVSIRTCRRCMR